VFVVDIEAQGIHVVLEDGRDYSHLVSVSWEPTYAHIMNDTLYLPDKAGNNLYTVTLDATYKKVSTNLIISSTFKGPRQLYVDTESIAMIIGFRLTVFNNDAEYVHQWEYYVPGNPKGVTKDSNGRYLMASFEDKAIMLVSPEGHFLGNIVRRLPGNPFGIKLTGNTIYVTTFNPSKLYKFIVN
jgi:sugar lactone lactonase YvrE